MIIPPLTRGLFTYTITFIITLTTTLPTSIFIHTYEYTDDNGRLDYGDFYSTTPSKEIISHIFDEWTIQNQRHNDEYSLRFPEDYDIIGQYWRHTGDIQETTDSDFISNIYHQSGIDGL